MKIMHSIFAALLMISACAFGQFDDEEPYGPQPLGKEKAKKAYKEHLAAYKGNTNFLVLPGLVADRKKGKVEVLAESTGIAAEEIAEFLLVDKTSSHGYEAMLWSHAKPSDIHRALEFIGLKPGTPYDPRALRFWADGDRVDVTVREVDGEDSFPIERMIMDTETGESLPEEGFVFTGSMLVKSMDGKKDAIYAADEYDPKSVASVYNEPSAVLDVPRQVNQAESYERQVVNPEFNYDHGHMFIVEMAPNPEYAKKRAKHLRLYVEYDAASSNMLYSLNEKGGETLVESGPLSLSISNLVAFGKSGQPSHVEVEFKDSVPLSEAVRTCKTLTVMEVMGMAMISPPPKGQLYYRAFTPNDSWADHNGRPSQPWELHLNTVDGKLSGELVRYQPVWADGSIEPTFKKKEMAAASPEAMRDALAKDAEERRNESLSRLPDVLLVFVKPDLKYGQLTGFLKPVASTHGTVYVFIDDK